MNTVQIDQTHANLIEVHQAARVCITSAKDLLTGKTSARFIHNRYIVRGDDRVYLDIKEVRQYLKHRLLKECGMVDLTALVRTIAEKGQAFQDGFLSQMYGYETAYRADSELIGDTEFEQNFLDGRKAARRFIRQHIKRNGQLSISKKPPTDRNAIMPF